MQTDFENKTVLITGASRGIGKAMAIELAKAGANIVIAAKSVIEDARLGGTIYSAAEEIEAMKGKALAVPCDVRSEENIVDAVAKAVETFGGIDMLINNASAIFLTSTESIESKQYDLMHNINVRGALLVSKHCIPYLKKSPHAHIINLSPPLNFQEKWFETHLPYTLSKYSMTMIARGLAAELKQYKIGVNTLWPKTIIATAAVKNLLGGDKLIKMSRKPEIMAKAVCYILKRAPVNCTGNSFIDEDVLREEGITDFNQFSVEPGGRLYPDLFI